MSVTALPTDLVLLSELKEQGGVGLSDDLLCRLINVASEAVACYLKRPFLYVANDEEFPDVEGDPCKRNLQTCRRSLYLRRYPVTAVASVTIAGVAQNVATVTAADLPIATQPQSVWRTPKWDQAGKLLRISGWPLGRVAVTYSGGYWGPNMGTNPGGIPDLPRAIVQATILTTLRLTGPASKDGDLDLVMEETVGGWIQKWGQGSTSMAALVPMSARQLLMKYRRRWFS